MSSSPTLPDLADRAAQRDEDAQYYRQVLHELVEIGTRLARAIDRQAAPQPAAAPEPTAQPAPAPAPAPTAAPDLTIPFDRIARTIRRTIALARKLSEPAREAPGPKLRSQDRCAEGCDERCPSARQRRTDCTETDALHAEPCERADQPDFDAPELDADEDLDDDLDEQSLADLIASLRHDTGLATLTDAQLRQHHTPQTAPENAQAGTPGEMCDLCAGAARSSTGQPRTTHRARPGDPPAIPARPPRPRPGTGPPGP